MTYHLLRYIHSSIGGRRNEQYEVKQQKLHCRQMTMYNNEIERVCEKASWQDGVWEHPGLLEPGPRNQRGVGVVQEA
jgi:hypothetical protein